MKKRVFHSVRYEMGKFSFKYSRLEQAQISGNRYPELVALLNLREEEASKAWTKDKVVRFL